MTPRILCVHEDGPILQDLGRRLQISGCEVLLANAGIDALHLLDNVPVQGIVMSCQIDLPDGRSLRNVIRRFYPEMPVLLLSVEEIVDMPLHIFREYLQNPAAPVEV